MSINVSPCGFCLGQYLPSQFALEMTMTANKRHSVLNTHNSFSVYQVALNLQKVRVKPLKWLVA